MNDLEKAIRTNKKSWKYIDKNLKSIFLYMCNDELDTGVNEEDILSLMLKCLNIVVFELFVNKDNYRKYEPIEYSDEDFVNMVIESISSKKINQKIGDRRFKEINEFSNDFRKVLWSHAQYHRNDYFKLHRDINKKLTDDAEFGYLRECMMIVSTECLLRKTENMLKTP